jgi:glycosyltransferase involved in cell wall biosynthesis
VADALPLTILTVSYPLARVGPNAIGGAEQIVHLLDRHLVAMGHRSLVIAPAGSHVTGELIPAAAPPERVDRDTYERAIVAYRRVIQDVLAREPIDIVHLHGHDFDRYLPPEGPPVLVTLHLPPELITARFSEIRRPLTWATPVSRAQQIRLPHVPFLLPAIENGVAVEELPRSVHRRGFALALGRICPEKGFHLALEAARRAGRPLILAGIAFPFPEHQAYFEREIVPRLDRERRFIGPVSKGRKRRLLSAARCVLVPSVVHETSSLVAMEAIACGTPVIGFGNGALPDIVDEGVTGFVVRSVEEMSEAIGRAGRLDARACRDAARERFSSAVMARRYVERYEWMLLQSRSRETPAAPSSLSA